MKTKSLELLSLREQDVLAQVANGKTSKEIAEELFLAEDTIRTHRKNIKKKLGANSAVCLIKAALGLA